MTDQRQHCACSPRCLREILLACLLADDALCWPGGDSLTIEEVLASYVLTAHQGRVPGQDELCRLYPELEAEISILFDEATPGIPVGECIRSEARSLALGVERLRSQGG